MLGAFAEGFHGHVRGGWPGRSDRAPAGASGEESAQALALRARRHREPQTSWFPRCICAEKIERDLAAGAACGHAKTEHTCRRILKFSGALWTFAHKPGVEPTNNAAERAIRPAVLWRKRSFGTHSEHGSRFAERMPTTFMTLKQQQRPVVDYVRELAKRFSKAGESHLSCRPSK